MEGEELKNLRKVRRCSFEEGVSNIWSPSQGHRDRQRQDGQETPIVDGSGVLTVSQGVSDGDDTESDVTHRYDKQR